MTQNNLSPAERAGKNLKNLIKESEYKTQENFAYEGIHVDPVTVRRWIAHGIKDVNTIQEIANIFGVDFMELLK
jgi:hypothetical protein